MAAGDMFGSWRVAHQQAVAAARAMLIKSMRALDGMGEPPSAAEADEVRRLRRAANSEFHAAMARMDDVVGPARSGARSAARPARDARR